MGKMDTNFLLVTDREEEKEDRKWSQLAIEYH